MKNINWDNVEELKDFERIAAGGYVCGITKVEDVSGKEYLKIEYDIAEGHFKNYYRSLWNSKGFWGGSFIKSYKESALPFFKAFKTAVENSNPGYKFNNQEQTLIRKIVGLVLAEEEYISNDGKTKTRLYVAEVHSADKIRKGEFSVPDIKRIKITNSAPKTQNNSYGMDFEEIVSDDDLPF